MKVTVCKTNGEKNVSSFDNSNVESTLMSFVKILKDGECLIISELTKIEKVRCTVASFVQDRDDLFLTCSIVNKSIVVHHGNWTDYPDIHNNIGVEFIGDDRGEIVYETGRKKHGIWTDVVQKMCSKGCERVEIHTDSYKQSHRAYNALRHHIVTRDLPYRLSWKKRTDPTIVYIISVSAV